MIMAYRHGILSVAFFKKYTKTSFINFLLITLVLDPIT